MTMRVATNSWQAREALSNRTPFNTYGSFRAVQGAYPLPWGTRLPDEWRDQYKAAERDDRITYTVLSYETPIAWVLDDGTVVRPPVKYSITTTGHQGLLYALERPGDAAIADAAQRERQSARERRARNAEMREQGYRRIGTDAFERPAPRGVRYGPGYELRTVPTPGPAQATEPEPESDHTRLCGCGGIGVHGVDHGDYPELEPERESRDIMDRIGKVLDPARDPQFPYNRTHEQRILRDVDRYEATRVRGYNADMDGWEDFDPDVVELHGTALWAVEDRPVPHWSGEGAIYTPEYLARTQPNTKGVDPDAWRWVS